MQYYFHQLAICNILSIRPHDGRIKMTKGVYSQEWTFVDTRLVGVKMLVARKVQSLICCCSQVDDLEKSIFHNQYDS